MYCAVLLVGTAEDADSAVHSCLQVGARAKLPSGDSHARAPGSSEVTDAVKPEAPRGPA